MAVFAIDKSSYIPAYVQLKRQITGRIQNGEYQSGDRLPSLRDFCKTTGLSYLTVSKTVGELVQEGVLVAEAGRGTFVAIGKPRRTVTIGVVLGPQIKFPLDPTASPFTYDLLVAVNGAAAERGHRLRYLCTTAAGELPETDGLDGLLLVNADGQVALARSLAAASLPVVCINKPWDDYPGYCVDSTDFEGGYESARYMIELGHRRLHVLKSQGQVRTYQRRMEGILKAFADAGRQLRDEDIFFTNSPYRDGTAYARAQIEQKGLPTGILASSDFAALAVLDVLAEHGIRVPETVSVIGFVDSSVLANMSKAITTIHKPIVELGRGATEMLFELIEGRHPPTVRQQTYATRLIVRETTAPPP